MIKKLIHFDNILLILFASGLTMGLLAQWLSYPGKIFHVIGTLVMFIAALIWTYKGTS